MSQYTWPYWLTESSPSNLYFDTGRYDIGHSILYTGLGGNIAQIVFLYGLALALSRLGLWGGLGIWPVYSPLVVQLLIVMLLGDLHEYWYHRLTHTVAWLWPLHAVHHTPIRLHALSTVLGAKRLRRWSVRSARLSRDVMPLPRNAILYGTDARAISNKENGRATSILFLGATPKSGRQIARKRLKGKMGLARLERATYCLGGGNKPAPINLKFSNL